MTTKELDWENQAFARQNPGHTAVQGHSMSHDQGKSDNNVDCQWSSLPLCEDGCSVHPLSGSRQDVVVQSRQVFYLQVQQWLSRGFWGGQGLRQQLSVNTMQEEQKYLILGEENPSPRVCSRQLRGTAQSVLLRVKATIFQEILLGKLLVSWVLNYQWS